MSPAPIHSEFKRIISEAQGEGKAIAGTGERPLKGILKRLSSVLHGIENPCKKQKTQKNVHFDVSGIL